MLLLTRPVPGSLPGSSRSVGSARGWAVRVAVLLAVVTLAAAGCDLRRSNPMDPRSEVMPGEAAARAPVAVPPGASASP
jgi:hypothetical protein